MTHRKITAVVEGQGELAAVPVLLRRIAIEILPEEWVDFPRPHRISRGSLLAAGGVERTVAAIAEQSGPQDSALVLLDADDDCPVDLAARLRTRVKTERSDRGSSVVVANREFEACSSRRLLHYAAGAGLLPISKSPRTPRRRETARVGSAGIGWTDAATGRPPTKPHSRPNSTWTWLGTTHHHSASYGATWNDC
jgi:hypothetical protein